LGGNRRILGLKSTSKAADKSVRPMPPVIPG